jgi:two-component system response regulator HydG
MHAKTFSILVVDDESDTCRNLYDILTDLGYAVDTAENGPAALELVQQKTYDVALLDLKMPGMDGLTLYREIKKLSAGTVAIIVTAYASGSTQGDALAAGAWTVLPKPIDFPRLLGLVEKACDQPMLLVVDDDKDLCSNLWDLFRERGFRVWLAHDQEEAKQRLALRVYHVVLIDMKLPLGDGTQVFQLVRESNPEARTILITGHGSELELLIRKVLSEGANAVCYKPFDVPMLLNMVEEFTQGAK